MSLNYIDIVQNFEVNPDSCDNPGHYESYIKHSAILDYKQGLGTTHLFIQESDDNTKILMGYLTLRASSLIKEMGEASKFGFPALEIAELAVSKDFERKGIGTDMVKYAISKAIELCENEISVKYVVLCADPRAIDFYKKIGFSPISSTNDIPREHANLKCFPMCLSIKSF